MLWIRRIKQVLHYGWKHSKIIEKVCNNERGRLYVFLDILYCFFKYKMWSNQYLQEKFYLLANKEREEIGSKYYNIGVYRDTWLQDFFYNRKFLSKYSSRRWGKSPNLMQKRNEAYRQRYHMGDNCYVEYNVDISRQHMLDGTIKIGKNVLLAKNVFIDYSGDVVIEDGVKISADVKIESHGHASYTNAQQQGAYKTPLHIEKNVRIGMGTVIMEGCKHIGKEARIGAGTVVRSNIPPYAIVIGNPARIIGFALSPEELEMYEDGKYGTEERTNIDQYKKTYEKYFSSRSKDIMKMLKL